MKRKIKINIKLHKQFILICTVFFFFPLVVGAIYALPFPQIIDVESGDLLAYYGTVFGILGSFVTYRNEIKKQKKEREQRLKPLIFIDVIQDNDNPEIFTIKIVNKSENVLSYFHLYDESVSSIMEKNYSFRVMYSQSEENENKLKPDYNITMDDEIIDSDGKPKYVQILCEDIEGNMWNCCYYKINDGSKTYYYPRDFEII